MLVKALAETRAICTRDVSTGRWVLFILDVVLRCGAVQSDVNARDKFDQQPQLCP